MGEGEGKLVLTKLIFFGESTAANCVCIVICLRNPELMLEQIAETASVLGSRVKGYQRTGD